MVALPYNVRYIVTMENTEHTAEVDAADLAAAWLAGAEAAWVHAVLHHEDRGGLRPDLPRMVRKRNPHRPRVTPPGVGE